MTASEKGWGCRWGCLCLAAERGEDQAKERDTQFGIAAVRRDEQLSPPQLTWSAAMRLKLRIWGDLYLPCLVWGFCALFFSFLLTFGYSAGLLQGTGCGCWTCISNDDPRLWNSHLSGAEGRAGPKAG